MGKILTQGGRRSLSILVLGDGWKDKMKRPGETNRVGGSHRESLSLGALAWWGKLVLLLLRPVFPLGLWKVPEVQVALCNEGGQCRCTSGWMSVWGPIHLFKCRGWRILSWQAGMGKGSGWIVELKLGWSFSFTVHPDVGEGLSFSENWREEAKGRGSYAQTKPGKNQY